MKPIHPPPLLSRRAFLGTCCSAVTATGLLSQLAQLRLIGAVAATDSQANAGSTTAAQLDPGHKALVCLFLAGGNDSNNMVVPTDVTRYQEYAKGRGALGLPREALLPVSYRSPTGQTYGLHPAMPEVRSMFDRGSAAIVANVGTLLHPTTRAQYTNRTVPLPPGLYGHNSGQVDWQSSLPDRGFHTGWGGRVADLTQSLNGNNRVSMSLSVAGQNFFQVGRNVSQYSVNLNGGLNLGEWGPPGSTAGLRTSALDDIINLQNQNLFETAYAGIMRGAIDDGLHLSSFLKGPSPYSSFFSSLNSSLSQQLHMICRLVALQQPLGLRRQVFFAQVNGWDLHDSQLSIDSPVSGAHANLLRDVSRSVDAFYSALRSIGAENQVTTFTASDFGRTLGTNGDGSDHAWGSHHLVMGGAVRGAQVYGKMPEFQLGGPDDAGDRGLWIPTISVDEYSATLAKWFGVSAPDLPIALPNIGRFSQPDLGFMKS